MVLNNGFCVQFGGLHVSRSVSAKTYTSDTITLPVAVSQILNIKYTSFGTFSSNCTAINGNTSITIGGKNSNTANSGTYTGGYWCCFCII